MKSKAKSRQAREDSTVLLQILLAKRYMTGTIAMPNKVPMIRQPKGFMPNSEIPRAMNILPMGGWVFS